MALGFCTDLFDSMSSVNQSWICLDKKTKLDLMGINETAEQQQQQGDCYFLRHQQFNRSHWFCGHAEAAIMIGLTLCIVPLNILAIRNFYKRHPNVEFLILIIAMVVTNILVTPLGIIFALARVLDDYPLGKVGCVTSTTASCILVTNLMTVMALVSNERRICLTKNVRNRKSRVWRVLICLVVTALFSSVIWGYAMIYAEAVQLVTVRIDGVKSGGSHERLVDVCIFEKSKLSYLILPELLFAKFTFFIPLVITVVNYVWVWMFLRRRQVQLQGGHQTIRAESLASVNNRRREAALSLLMAGSVAQFLVCILPLLIAMFCTRHEESSSNPKIQSITVYMGKLLLLFNSAINPYWSTIIRVGPSAKRQSVNSDPTSSANGAPDSPGSIRPRCDTNETVVKDDPLPDMSTSQPVDALFVKEGLTSSDFED